MNSGLEQEIREIVHGVCMWMLGIILGFICFFASKSGIVMFFLGSIFTLICYTQKKKKLYLNMLILGLIFGIICAYEGMK